MCLDVELNMEMDRGIKGNSCELLSKCALEVWMGQLKWSQWMIGGSNIQQ